MFEQYIIFIITQIIKDSHKVQFEYGWNFLVIPYIYWLFLFLFKYMILTLPIWGPINMVMPTINNIVNRIKN